MRTEAALACIDAISKEAADIFVGAGTILNKAQAEQAMDKGAQFIVSPGLDEGVVEFCNTRRIDVFPGVITPSEMQRAQNLGLRRVKFFPAGLAGGAPMLKALSAVFGEMQFMPTGGVSAQNLKDYLALPSVIACGGSWLTPRQEIEARNFSAVTKLAVDAVAIAKLAKQ